MEIKPVLEVKRRRLTLGGQSYKIPRFGDPDLDPFCVWLVDEIERQWAISASIAEREEILRCVIRVERMIDRSYSLLVPKSHFRTRLSVSYRFQTLGARSLESDGLK